MANRVGRKKRPGSIETNYEAGTIQIFVGYCQHGEKVLLPLRDYQKLVRYMQHTRRSPKQRLVEYLLKH